MDKELVTLNSIWGYFEKAIEDKQVLSPGVWLDGATKLNVLLLDQQDKVTEMENLLAIMVEKEQNNGASYTRAKNIVMTKREWVETEKLKNKVKRVEELIRILKKRSESNYWDI